MTITDDQWSDFEKNGYVKLGRVLDPTALADLQARIDAIMLGTADIDYSNLLTQPDSKTGEYGDAPEQSNGHKGATLAYRKIQNLEIDPLFREFIEGPTFASICERAYGDAPIACFRAM